jgi:hypothetical protein
MLGKVRLTAIDTAVVDALYDKLLVVKETDADGKRPLSAEGASERGARGPRKTGEENWIPLFDEQTIAPFFPELMAELDTIKEPASLG